MNIKQTIAALVVSFGVAATVGVTTLAAEQVECSVLPAAICNSANEGDLEQSAIWQLLIWIINILTVGIGVVAVGAIVFAGFLYATARDDAGQVKKSLEIIRNTVIGLIVYAFMFAIINFLVPGGIFDTSSAPAPTQPAPTPGGPREAV